MERERVYSEQELREIEAEISRYRCDTDKGYAFVSYSHLDRSWVLPIVCEWIRAGYNIYIDADFRSHASNCSWVRLMQDAIRNRKCHLMVCFWSESYMYSYAALLELLTARSPQTLYERRGNLLSIDIVTGGPQTIDIPEEVPENIRLALHDTFQNIRPDGTGTIFAGRREEYDVLYQGILDWRKGQDHKDDYVRIAKNYLSVLKKERDTDFFYALSALMRDWITSLKLGGNINDLSCEAQYGRFDNYGVERIRSPEPPAPPAVGPASVERKKEEKEEEKEEAKEEPERTEPQSTPVENTGKQEFFCVVTDPSEDAASESTPAGLEPDPDDREDFEMQDTVLVKYKGSKSVVTVPDGVVYIDDSAFSCCSQLQEVILPDSVVSIGSFAFEFCEQLERIILPESICSIGMGAFCMCNKLKEINIPSYVMFIGERTFYDCQSLEKIDNCRHISSIGSEAFRDCRSLQTIDISRVLSIGSGAFQDCSNLQTVKFDSDIQLIGSYAFADCDELRTVQYTNKEDCNNSFDNILSFLSDNDFRIGDHAFEYCRKLERIDIPDSVCQIGRNAFSKSGDFHREKLEIHFGGTRSQWDAAKKDHTGLKNAKILFANAEDEPLFLSSTSDLTLTLEEQNSFEIDGTVLVKYTGTKSIVTIPHGVVCIGSGAFQRCQQLQKIIITDRVLYINDYAFANCEQLQSVTMSANLVTIGRHAFFRCTQIESIDLPEGVSSIGAGAFQHCKSLTKINIPFRVTFIGEDTFSGCESLQEIVIPYTVSGVGDSAFWDCSSLQTVRISDGAPEIEDDIPSEGIDWQIAQILDELKSNKRSSKRFYDSCPVLTNPVFSIGRCAFQGCEKLEIFHTPYAVSSIGEDAFQGCSSLRAFKAASTSSIGRYAFQGCSSLQEIVIPNGISSIADGAFLACKSLQTVKIPGSVSKIGAQAFRWCSSLKTVELPPSVSKIGDGAFQGCERLETIEIPYEISCIGEKAFADCESLQTVRVIQYEKDNRRIYGGGFLGRHPEPNSTMLILQCAFEGCSSLESVDIPITACLIGEYAFFQSGTEVGGTTIYFEGTKKQWNAIYKYNSEYKDIQIIFCGQGR